MKVTSLVGLLGLSALSEALSAPRDYAKNDYYVLHLDPAASPDHVATRLGLRHEGQLGELIDHHVFRAPKAEHDIVKRELDDRKLQKRNAGGPDVLDNVLFSSKQEARMRLHKRVIPPPPPGYIQPRATDKPGKPKANANAIRRMSHLKKTLNIADPIFNDQWHLFNPVQLGHDVNVTDLWLEGITGHNATVAIVDDGLDMHSRDLKDNYFAAGSWDFNDQDAEPAPELSDDRHGTRCAGEVAAGRNDACGVGVAYDSKIAGIRILSKAISDGDEAEAMIYGYQKNQIYSCSWGPPDDGRAMEAPGMLIRRAMLQGIQKGRNGLGTIYVFASGNGAASGDNCNFDGYTNSIYSITVGAVDREGEHPYYSEHCSAQLVVTYSSGSGDSIHTTDVGEDACTSTHGGTSAAAPLAAGIFALVMQVRPDLTWRDVQYLAIDTAALVKDEHADWQTTAMGRKFSHTFGYGKIDSYSLVQKAKDWKNVKPQAWWYSPWLHVKKPIPQGEKGLAAKFTVTKDMLKEANFERLEHVTVTMNVNHTRRGDLSVELISPEKISSRLATARDADNHPGGYVDWTFMSVVHWGESGVGEWTLIVRDTKENEFSGNFTDWRMKFWGESIDADQATLLPPPTEHDDDDHDVIVPVTSVTAVTTSVGPHPEATESHATTKPSDHPERPTKPAGKPAGVPEDKETNTQETTEASHTSSNWVSWLPSFGASKKAQAWIYGAVGLIVAFCAGLGIYFWIARRRRLRNNPLNNYEFELIDEEEGEGLNSGEKGPSNRRTRGGELYDAFAAGSDDEFDEYHDRERSADRRPAHGGSEEDEEQYVVGESSDDEDEHDRSQQAKPLTSSR